MKKIANKATVIKGQNGVFIDYKELIKVVLTTPPEGGGFSMTDVLTTKKIMDIVTLEKPEIDLEDADFKYLQTKVRTHVWPHFISDLAEFIELFK